MDSLTTSTVSFETELGRCTVRWSDAGISDVLLPKAGGRPGPAFEDGVAVPEFVRDAIDAITAVMGGEARDLRSIPLDERGVDDFRRAVYGATGLETSVPRWPATRSRSSFRATASLRRTGPSPDSRLRAASTRNDGCSSSRARLATASRSSSANASDHRSETFCARVGTMLSPQWESHPALTNGTHRSALAFHWKSSSGPRPCSRQSCTSSAC
jgi:hypothetical protein